MQNRRALLNVILIDRRQYCKNKAFLTLLDVKWKTKCNASDAMQEMRLQLD